MTMFTKEADAGPGEIERGETMALVEEAEAVVVAAAVEEAEKAIATAIATTPMQEEAVAASMEAEEATESIMDTTTTSTGLINNTLSRISNNKCLRQILCLIPCSVPDHSSRTTTWSAM